MTHPDDMTVLAAANEPAVGMGVTMSLMVDRLPGTVETIFLVGGDLAITCTVDQSLPDGTYRQEPKGDRYSFRRRPDGTWYEIRYVRKTETWRKASAGIRLELGHRYSHRSPEF